MSIGVELIRESVKRIDLTLEELNAVKMVFTVALDRTNKPIKKAQDAKN